jgi:hypothetical protein
MATPYRYLIETSSTDGYLLEDGSGVLLLEPVEDIVVYQAIYRRPEVIR